MAVTFTKEFIVIEAERLRRELWEYIGQIPVDEQHQDEFNKKVKLVCEMMDILIEMKNRNDESTLEELTKDIK